jgi:AhpD family alkylhydroperoxidase
MTKVNNRTFAVPARAEVSVANQAIFDKLQKGIGFVPNLYAYFAKNETALGDYLGFQGRKSTLNGKEREIVNLVTSQINGCRYCQSAHTALAKLNGFTNEQIMEIRRGSASFNSKFDALAKLTASIVNNKGRAAKDAVEGFFEEGYTEANLIDLIIAVGDKIISNYVHNLTQIEIDFPLAEEIN